jgi:hypothetical protein
VTSHLASEPHDATHAADWRDRGFSALAERATQATNGLSTSSSDSVTVLTSMRDHEGIAKPDDASL